MQAVDLSDRITLEDATVSSSRAAPACPPTAAIWPSGRRRRCARRPASRAARGSRSTSGSRWRPGWRRLGRRRGCAAGAESAVAAALARGAARRGGDGLGDGRAVLLRGGTALATGRGERLEPLRGRSLGLVLVNPRFAVSTAEMYARVTPAMYTDGRHAKTARAGFGGRSPPAWPRASTMGCRRWRWPRTRRSGGCGRRWLAAGALGALMSGSGPTVFGRRAARSSTRGRSAGG